MMQNIKENINNIKVRKDKTYITYTILFCVISFIIFAIFIKNNRSFIWQTDGIKQHFVILYDFNQIIRNLFNEGIPLLSWNMGLGLDIIGQYSYYIIGDPFAYISLLFPMDKLEIAYNFLVLLRMYCVGLAFITYCKYTKKEKFNIILGTIIYTFCGFILYAGIRHPYFINAAIFLPLTLLGTEKLLKENKKNFFIFIIFISAVSNYYFFYMVTIINFIYGITKYIFEYNEGFKIFIKKIASAIICYIIGLLMASVILLPTVYAFFNSARTESIQVTTYISNYYKFLYMGIFSMRFKNWAVIAVSVIVLLMIPILFTKLKNKEVRTYLVLFIITTIMLLIPKCASMMNGFSFPSNRWVFGYSFILAYIVVLGYDKKLEYSKKQKIYMFVTLIIYSLVGILITKLKIKQNLDYYIIGIIAYLIYLVITYRYKNKRDIKLVNYMMLTLVIVNIFIISMSLYSSKGRGYAKEFIKNGHVLEKCASANGKIEKFKEAIEYIKENDEDFYRISKKYISYQNLSLIYDYNPIQLYLSIGNKYVYNLSCQLEDNCYSSTKCVNSADRRTKYTTLLSSKYYICDKEDFRYVPYGYKIYHEIGNTQIYINENYIPIGIVYDTFITKEQFNNLTPLEKEDALISTAILENSDNVNIENDTNIRIDTPISLSYLVKDEKMKDNKININQKNESIELVIDDIPENHELYLSIENLKFVSVNNSTDFKITAKIDGISNNESVANRIASAYYMENLNFLMNLGITKKGQSNKLKLVFNKIGIYTFDNLEILAVDMKKYESKIEKLKINSMENIKYGKNYISGTVNINKNGILQLTTSYSDGWKVFVDGKESEIIKVNEAFIGTCVEIGEHEIEFRYKSPYFKLGTLFSILGVILYMKLFRVDYIKTAKYKTIKLLH